MRAGNNGKKQEEPKGGETSRSETDSVSNDLGKITPRSEAEIEERYTAMLLDVMRGANKQDRAAILGTIDSFHPHRNEATEVMDMPFFRKHASSKEEKGQEEGQTPPEKEPDEDQDTVEYDFCFVNAVIATVERFSLEGKDVQIPTDFYYIIAEARDRLDKIRTILGYLR